MDNIKVGYARVSTVEQDLTVQRNALLALGVDQKQIFVDHGLTGANRARPGRLHAMAAVREGDILVVTKLDRLARSLTDARDIADELTAKGVLLSLGGSIYDPTDPIGKLLFNVLGIVAEFEADLIRMRTREGMAIAKARGGSVESSRSYRRGSVSGASRGLYRRGQRHNRGMAAPIVLLHGWACPASYWNPVAGLLREAGREVLNLDLPGYGSPLEPDFEWTVENVAAVFALELSSRAPVHWVGHSLGGSIAATIGARYPRTTASLTLVGMVPVAPSAAAEEKLRRLFGGPEAPAEDAADEMLAAWFRGGEEPRGEDRERFLAPFRLPPAVVRKSLEAGITGAAPDVPDLVAAPALVVTGTRDGVRTPDIVRDFLRGHPAWRHELVTDAGHMVHWERPKACAEAVLKHVARAEGR